MFCPKCSRSIDLVFKRAVQQIKIGLNVCRLLPTYIVLGLLKHTVPLHRLARWTWRPSIGPRNHQVEQQLTLNVLRLSQLMGLFDRDCLQRSLLLYRILSRAGANPTLVVGFHRLDGQVIGHAWVTVDGDVIIEGETNLRQFSPALCFGSRGILIPMNPDLRPI